LAAPFSTGSPGRGRLPGVCRPTEHRPAQLPARRPSRKRMKVILKLHASLMDRLPPGTQGHAVTLEVGDGTPVGEVLEQYRLSPAHAKIVLVNGHYIAPEARASCRLNEGDHLAVWPPIAGG
jgi:sulfur carrier protein ThiS